MSDKTTDKLLEAYKKGTASETEKRYLELMLFQYGRYLTMGSSRETPVNEDGTKNERRATLPSNLQGIWVGANNSAWAFGLSYECQSADELLADIYDEYGGMRRTAD